MSSSTAIICSGCGWVAPPLDPTPFRCGNSGQRAASSGQGNGHPTTSSLPATTFDDVDHVLYRRLTGTPEIVDDPNPFVRFRQLTHAWHTAMQIGMSDG